MARTLLIRGMLVGLVAGVLAFIVAKTLGESQIGHAITFESAGESSTHAHEAVGLAAHAHEESEPVSRTVQSTLGLFTGLLLFSVAIGGMFALAYACVQGRLGALGPRGTAALVALAGFTAVYLLPDLKYPANPPAIGNPDTIGRRTVLYFLMILISVIVVVGTGVAARRLGGWNATIAAVVGGLVVLGVVYAVLPRVHETPEGFPADVLWRFRIASLAIQATVWAAIGLLFGALTERASRRAAAPTSAIGAIGAIGAAGAAGPG
ncbi:MULTISPECIES: CbtA family protein [unclassified Frankia]